MWLNVAASMLLVPSVLWGGCGGKAEKKSKGAGTESTSGSTVGSSTRTSAATGSGTSAGSGGSATSSATQTSSSAGGSNGTSTTAGAGGSTPGSGGAGGSGGEASGGTAGAGGEPSETYCEQPSDCTWGEISHEILEPGDCVCLYGCAFLPLNKETVMRRNEQYQEHCSPSVDGQGNPCGIDDCILPPEPTCENNTCGPEDPFGS